MGKKHRNKNRDNQGQKNGGPDASAANPTALIQSVHTEAQELMTEQDLSASTADPAPADSSPAALWVMVQQTRNIYQGAKDRADRLAEEGERRTSELRDKLAELEEREKAILSREQELSRRASEVGRKDKELSGNVSAMMGREEAIRLRELNAEAGFIAERKAALQQLDLSAESIRADIETLEKRLRDKREELAKESETARSRLEEELRSARLSCQSELSALRSKTSSELDAAKEEREAGVKALERDLSQREIACSELKRQLDSTKRQLQAQEEDLKEYRKDLDARAQERAAGIKETLEYKVMALEAQLESARQDRDQLDEALRQRREADRRFGQRSPDEVLKELQGLQEEVGKLRKTIAERPDASAASRLMELETARESWQSERIELQRRAAELERRLAQSTIAAIELETLRDHKAALESGRSVLQQAVKELKSEVETLLKSADSKTVFPGLSAMDADPELQSVKPLYESIGDLAVFADDLRNRIGQSGLSYSAEDIRSFIGGLSMGPLVLLQGISGTGKTSLPISFAQAVGTKVEPIEVQAGWRDPQDLIGHYNSFEKRFYEKEFLKALYRAQTPRWRDTLQIILLDEMNLSHPEQYFSDLLSALARTQDRRLGLMTHSVEGAPKLLQGGRWLPIPENVWFVGTANHDETTKDFADKTYDRSHVMQFPNIPPQFSPRAVTPRSPVSFQALRKSFALAKTKNALAAEASSAFLKSHVQSQLAEHFEIGWGPRLEQQLRSYVPVVIAAGGTVGEATDHLLAMRLLRKLRNRHDNRHEHVQELSQVIREKWSGLDAKTKPTKSVALLNAELQRLGFAPESSS